MRSITLGRKSPSWIGQLLLVALLTKGCAPEPPPDAQVVAKTAVELWQAKRLTELERYLTDLAHKHPKRLSAVVGTAFLDLIYRVDYDAAIAKLMRIIATVNAEQVSGSPEFRLQLVTQAESLRLISKEMDRVGISKEQKKREANPAQMRDFFGSELPDLLILLQLTPDADLP